MVAVNGELGCSEGKEKFYWGGCWNEEAGEGGRGRQARILSWEHSHFQSPWAPLTSLFVEGPGESRGEFHSSDLRPGWGLGERPVQRQRRRRPTLFHL